MKEIQDFPVKQILLKSIFKGSTFAALTML